MTTHWRNLEIDQSIFGNATKVHSPNGSEVQVVVLEKSLLNALNLESEPEWQDTQGWESSSRQKEYLWGRWLLRKLLAQPSNHYLGEYKVWPQELKKKVSLSHSRHYIAAAVRSEGAGGPFGLDIAEPADHRFVKDSVRAEALKGFSGLSVSVCQAWTAKEAAYKGSGRKAAFRKMTTYVHSPRTFTSGGLQGYWLRSSDSESYMLAVAFTV